MNAFTAKLYEKEEVGSIDNFILAWPRKAQTTAYGMVEKYGLPREATPSMLIWYYNGPWKRTIVHRKGSTHNFPVSHVDLLEQVVDYWVPMDKIDDVVAFDGSISVDRTKGEMSVCCDKESTNFLALNLAHDIIMGKSTVKEAREKYADTILGLRRNWQDKYTEELMFYVPEDNETATSDPDEQVSNHMIKRIGSKLGL